MIKWKLKEVLKKHNIKNGAQLLIRLKEDFGIIISRQSLHKLMNQEPENLRIHTVQLICNLLGITLNDILTIEPDEKPSKEAIPVKIYEKHINRRCA